MRRVVQPQGKRAVAESAADDKCHVADGIQPADILREEALPRRIQSALAETDLPAVRVPAHGKGEACTFESGGVLRMVQQQKRRDIGRRDRFRGIADTVYRQRLSAALQGLKAVFHERDARFLHGGAVVFTIDAALVVADDSNAGRDGGECRKKGVDAVLVKVGIAVGKIARNEDAVGRRILHGIRNLLRRRKTVGQVQVGDHGDPIPRKGSRQPLYIYRYMLDLRRGMSLQMPQRRAERQQRAFDDGGKTQTNSPFSGSVP